MGLPKEPVTLSLEQLTELERKLSAMRHDVNGSLSLIVAAVEMIRYKPQTAERMMATLAEQPSKISALLGKFSSEFDQALGITKG